MNDLTQLKTTISNGDKEQHCRQFRQALIYSIIFSIDLHSSGQRTRLYDFVFKEDFAACKLGSFCVTAPFVIHNPINHVISEK